MKKFSKVLTGVLSALLLTVGGVNFTSCSNDDGETKTPSLTVSGDAITVESGKTVTATVKGTLADDSFKALAVADFPASCVTVTSDDFTVGTIALKEALAKGATVATITVGLTAKTVTAEKKGTLSVKVSLPAEALNSGKAIEKTGTVAYTITAATTPDPTPTGSGTTFTLDAAKQTAADSITSGTEYASAEDASFKFAFLGTACKIDGDPQRFNFSGKLSKDVAAENKGCIAFTAKAGDVVKVYYYNTNAGRYPQLATKAKAKVAIESASTKPTTTDATLYDYTFAAITADGDYVVGAGADTNGGVWVTKIVITRN